MLSAAQRAIPGLPCPPGFSARRERILGRVGTPDLAGGLPRPGFPNGPNADRARAAIEAAAQ